MTTFGSNALYGQGLNGAAPGMWADTAAVDGDRPPWRRMPVGQLYLKKVTANQQEIYQKVKDDGRNDDWVLISGRIVQRTDYSEYTDSTATGTLSLNATIPVGAVVERAYLVNNTDATGVSTLTINIGGGSGADPDRYMTGNPSVATAAAILDLGVPSGLDMHIAAITPIVILTEDDDFTDVTAWAATVVIEYTGTVV